MKHLKDLKRWNNRLSAWLLSGEASWPYGRTADELLDAIADPRVRIAAKLIACFMVGSLALWPLFGLMIDGRIDERLWLVQLDSAALIVPVCFMVHMVSSAIRLSRVRHVPVDLSTRSSMTDGV
jgi:hypothetical protein